VPDSPLDLFALQRDLMDDEACYVCDACGEEIVVPVDPTARSGTGIR